MGKLNFNNWRQDDDIKIFCLVIILLILFGFPFLCYKWYYINNALISGVQ